jgi:hypothetical protein
MSNFVGVARRRRASESVRNRLSVDSELAGNVGQRHSGRIQLRRFLEGSVVPSRVLPVARDPVAVEVPCDRGAVDAVVGGQLAAGGAYLVGRDEVVDVGGGEASLGRV